jgi:hypothetical protein
MAGSERPSYISALPIRGGEAEKLRGLGADTPQQLLAQISAAPDAFARYLGPEAAQRIERALRAMLPVGQPTEPISPPGPLGVPLGPGPRGLPKPAVDLARRDELFNQIQRLKANHAPTHQIEAAERALENLFEKARG